MLTRMTRSMPERNRSVWKRCAEWSSSAGRSRSSAALPIAFKSLKCIVYMYTSVRQ